MDKFNELNACFNIENFKCYTCKKSYSNIEDFSKHLISIQHDESINYNIGLIDLDTQILKLIEKDKKDEHEKRMNSLKQELLEINKRTDKLREEHEEHEERVRIEKETINAFLSLFCLKIV